MAHRSWKVLIAAVISAAWMAGADAAPAAIDSMFNGAPPPEADLPAWFRTMHDWGVRQWMSFLLVDFRPRSGGRSVASVPFLAGALPAFQGALDANDVRAQEEALRAAARLSAENGIEFWVNLPFPILPSLDGKVERRLAPELFRGAKFDLYSPALPDLLRREVRALKAGLPQVRGVNLWICEGAGNGVEITREDLLRNEEWEEPLIGAFDDETRRLGIHGLIFAHHYLHTVRTQRNVFVMMARHPRLAVMEDTTWPEEDMLHPFLGYLPAADRALLFRDNPVAINFLLDTEYLGQGDLPGVYARWWKYGVDEAVRSGARTAMGRVFFWDRGRTAVNFNRLNAYVFSHLCNDPSADPRALLREAARERFGPGMPERLVEILWETEPMIKRIVGLNGVDVFDHSAFPQPRLIDSGSARPDAMKDVEDLFSPPGTRLYSEAGDNLANIGQWRWQNRITARPAEEYLEDKRTALAWLRQVSPEVARLSRELPEGDREMFTHGYAMLEAMATGAELFIETAAAHRAWSHEHTLEGAAARQRFDDLAGRWRALAGRVPINPFLDRERMLAFAKFLERLPGSQPSGSGILPLFPKAAATKPPPSSSAKEPAATNSRDTPRQ